MGGGPGTSGEGGDLASDHPNTPPKPEKGRTVPPQQDPFLTDPFSSSACARRAFGLGPYLLHILVVYIPYMCKTQLRFRLQRTWRKTRIFGFQGMGDRRRGVGVIPIYWVVGVPQQVLRTCLFPPIDHLSCLLWTCPRPSFDGSGDRSARNKELHGSEEEPGVVVAVKSPRGPWWSLPGEAASKSQWATTAPASA